jgi:hypothetical protein
VNGASKSLLSSIEGQLLMSKELQAARGSSSSSCASKGLEERKE